MRGELGDPKRIVRTGYDRISEAYRGDTFDLDGTWYATALEALDGVLAPGSRVLDLGCGCGVPVARHLARTHHVTGVDLSSRQIERASSLVPDATFVRADMTSIGFSADAFDAVVSVWAIIHVPVEQQPALFDVIARWLRPSGVLLLTAGSDGWTGTEDDWYGAPMYWSHGDRDFYATELDVRGFTIVEEWLIPEGDGAHAAFLARLGDPDGARAPG